MKTDIKNSLKITKKVINSMISDKNLIEKIKKSVEICLKCLNKKNKILLAGNGGSAADAQHIAAEFVGKFAFDRQSLAAIALTTDTSVITAISNDYGYEKIFARQIESIGKSGDVFIAYTTSGKSKNIIHALKIAKKMGLITIAMTANNKHNFKKLCDICLIVKSKTTSKIQEGHTIIGHLLCELIEKRIFNPKNNK